MSNAVSAVYHSASSCAYCEYFDGGGQKKVEKAIKDADQLAGDCLNTQSPRFQTNSDDVMPCFVQG